MVRQLLFLLAIFKTIFCVKLYLTVEENQKPFSPIGNLQKLIQNQTKGLENMEFKSFQMENDKHNNYGQRNLITIDQKSGDIWLQSAIDREEICQPTSKCENGAFLDYLIFAESLTIQIYDLQIEVLDINDNYPQFQPDEKTLKIPEGITKMTEYSLPVAKDKDSFKYGIKSYSLKPTSSSIYESYFKLVMKPPNNNPYLQVIKDLDRESIKDYEFNLYAIDGSGNQGKCKINIEITDINDNTPQWIGLPFRKEISECTTEGKVYQLTAHDKDDPQTEGGQIRYKISDNSPNVDMVVKTFFITDNTLYLNNGALKTFGQTKASIVVIASDGGGRSNETTVELDIKDCNDHRPLIFINDPSLKIQENQKSNTLVTKITVKDEDKGSNSEFSCSLNDTSYVNLEPHYQQNGVGDGSQKKIFLLKTIAGTSFDRETTAHHGLEIQCTDNGQPQLSSSETITIYILDENDNAPRFENQLRTFSISEDAKVGQEVGKVVAKDKDSSPNNIVAYSISSNDSDIHQTFSINNYGQIQLNQMIDREKKERYDFFVIAVDNGKPNLSDSCKIGVIVLDVNDNAPEINKEHYFKIVESWNQEQKHVSIGKLNATDKDNGNNGTFIFRLRSTNPPSTTIQVTNDGKLTIYGIIDREKSDSIEAQVDVIDRGNPPNRAMTTIYIEVLDLNDNKPKFIFPKSYNDNFLNVSFDLPLGSIIGQVKAKDSDKDLNGTVIYSLIGGDNLKKIFAIHSDGQITLNEKLGEKLKPADRLIIEAKDQGNPPQRETTTLYLRYLKKKKEQPENSENLSKYKDSRDQFVGKKRHNQNAFSNSTVLLGFLIGAIVLILIGIIGFIVYLCYRGQGNHRMGDNSKHLPVNRDSSNVVYQKGSSKNHMLKSEINNETLIRNDTYNPVIAIPNHQQNYTNLMILKNNCYTPIDQSYQFGQTLYPDNYSAFQPKSSTPTLDKDHQEFTSFNPDEVWNSQKQVATMQIRQKNLSESSDNLYDTDHKYAFIHGSNLNGYDMNSDMNNIAHFTTPSQNRRADLIQSRPDTNQKVKVSLVNSSFV